MLQIIMIFFSWCSPISRKTSWYFIFCSSGSKQRRLHGQYVDNAFYMNMFDVLAMRIVGDRFQDKAKFTNFFGKREPTLYYKGGHYGIE